MMTIYEIAGHWNGKIDLPKEEADNPLVKGIAGAFTPSLDVKSDNATLR